MDFDSDQSLKEWARDKPLSILQLDPADRAVLRIADERDAIQKKTFTKWVNKHLKKANRHVGDLFIDLQDGLNLISLLEVLSGDQLPRERGKLRFHMLQNVQMALEYLRFKKIKLVNIRAEDIVDGNPKLTLGLIWTIILHFQISDIVVGEEPNVSARDALLKWARKSTSKYPGVRVSDFTSSWRDGMAFNAIIHRNRPDLVDWRNIKSKNVRERLESAFYTAEREYGVTRLLDPEDVDTHEIDEKSIITYISSLHEVFPEPPRLHPLYDSESQQRSGEYREIASSLNRWMREKLSVMSDRNFPPTLIEMKKLAAESTRFRNEELPPRHRDKQHLVHLYKELQKYFEAVGENDIEPELQADAIDRTWNRLMMSYQDRDSAIQEEIKRLERLQRLAEKVHRETKRTDLKLDELETRIVEEGRRADRLHPLDAKHNADQLETELRLSEDTIQSLFVDVQALREGRYVQAPELQKRVEKLHQRWVNLRSLLHSKVLTPLATLSFPIVEERTVTKQTRTILETRLVDTNTHFRSLQECIDWCNNKLKQLQEAEFGSDLPSVQVLLDQHKREHKVIDQFHTKVEHCINAKSNFHGDELALYSQHLNTLQKVYSELVTFSNKRLSDLETLQDFLQSATNQLIWLNEKEEIELNRDWSDKDLNIPSIRQYYETLMSELEKREIQLSSVQDRGEALILQGHLASKCIEAYISALQTQWTWLLQLTLCLETHLKHATYYHQFYADVKEAEHWLNKRDELLNSVFSQSEFSLDEGERLLKGMQDLREELNNFSEVIGTLEDRSRQVVPLKQRRLPITRPLPVNAICNFKQNGINVEKGSQWLLHDNSGRVKWRVSRGMNLTDDSNVPGVVFLIPPPDQEALDAVDRLRRAYDRTTALWQRKQLRMRQNMIFATIKVVKGWDLAQFLAMGADQRNAIRKALNEDANKLLREGDPADPQLRRLKREMDEVNRLFDEFERRSKAEEDSKNLTRMFTEQVRSIQISLDEYEHTLNTRLSAPIPRDMDTLEHLVIQHKDFETSLKSLGPDVEAMQATFKNIPNKTPALQAKHDKVLNQWNQLWNLSQLYVERLKCAEITLAGLEDANNVISDFEIKLASYGEMPSELPALKLVHQDLIALQKSVLKHQPAIDQLVEDKHNTRRLTEKSRHHLPRTVHHDLDRLDSDVNRITSRWNNVCSQLVDRLKSCEAAYDLLNKYKNAYQSEVQVIDENYVKLNNVAPLQMQARDLTETTRALYNKVQERTKAIESVNVDGGRFIREAKIYDLRLQHYCAWLIDEVHPSLDASNSQKGQSMDPSVGELAVSHELDVLNHRFQALLNMLIDQLNNLASVNLDDLELQEYVKTLEARPLRTFRTEFNIYNTVPEISTNGVDKTTIEETTVHKSSAMGAQHSSPTIGSSSDTDIRSLRRRMEEASGMDDDIINALGIVHPKTGKVLTVGEAIRLRVLDVRTGRIATQPDSKSGWVDIEQAVTKGLVDKNLANKLLGPCVIGVSGPQMTLLEAIQKEILDAERGPMERIKLAMAEKYKLCDDTLSEYLRWIGEIEDRIANQDIAQEDLDQLRNQINVLKLIKEEIDSQLRPITTCLDQVRHIIATGSEFLSREEINNVEKKGKSLKTRYDHANERTDKLLRRLTSAKDELSKFKSELTTFVTWMDRAQRTLDEKERALANINRLADTSSTESTREFVSDVIAHQADLRFITMAAQKFIDESKEYLICLNDFRIGLPSRLHHIEPVSSQDSVVKTTVSNVTNNYKDLLARANALSDKLSGLNSKQREYKDALNAVKAWFREAEPRAIKILNEPIGADPNALEDQLNRTKTLNNEFLGQSRLIENLKQAADALIRSLEGQSGMKEIEAIQGPVNELEDKYKSLCNGLADRLSQLDTALVQSHGVQDALDSLLHWLTEAEATLKNITRPVSLHTERLAEQIREYRLLQSDIDTHRASVDSVAHSTQELMINSSNPRLAKKIEVKLKDVMTRFEKLLDRTAKRGELLNGINQTLSSFNSQAAMLEQWLANALENFNDMPESKLDDLIAQRDSQRQALDQTIRDGKTLINNKDVTDTPPVRDRVKGLENQWKNLNQLLEEKQRLSKAKEEHHQAYEKLRDQVNIWLNNTEKRVNQLESVAVDMNIIKTQIDELKPIAKDHRDYSNTIDRLNELGVSFHDSSLTNSMRRRSSVSPTKRFSLDSLRKSSRDSLRSSVGSFTSFNRIENGLDDSPIQQELNEINNRYNLLGVKISDRQNELDSIRDDLRKLVENIKILNQFLDRTQKSLPKESIPMSKEESDKAARQVRAVLEEMYEKQSLLDSTKSGVNDILKKKPTSLGADRLHDDIQSVISRWKNLNDTCKNRIQLLEDLKDFHDSHDNLSNWLGAKERMLNVLGPISSDSRIVQSQVQQIQVLKEEFRTQQPQLTHLTSVGESILNRLPDPNSPDAQRFSNKLGAILQKWADLLGKLDERASNLGAAADSTREFDAGLARLTEALQNISDQLDDVSYDKEPEEKLRKIQNLERQLEGQRPLLADLEDAGNHLCNVLDDPACKADIQAKLAAVNRQYNNLQKKLDNKKAEIEGSLKDGRQFEATCALTLGWLSDQLGSLTERLLISADRDILQQQVSQYEPIYKEVLHKEHEVIMLLNKGRDIMSRAGQRNESRNLQRDLDKIQQNWEKLRKEAVDRHNRLQTCMEHCRKYYRAQESFLPWLTQAENKLELIRPNSLSKKDVDKQLRELSAFRNEVWKHSGEFENVKTLGETFLSSCDVDKELVKQELSTIKTRWDKLNNELMEKTQWLEDVSRKLADFSDNLRDSEHALQRCEDKLASHDSIGGAARDPKLLERIKALREDARKLRNPLVGLRQTAGDLASEAAQMGVGDALKLQDDVDNLMDRLDDLEGKLDDRCSQLHSASTALAQYADKVKTLGKNLNDLEAEFDSLKPPGRDIKTVNAQLDEVDKFIKKIARAGEDVTEMLELGQRLEDSNSMRDQAESLTRQLNKLDERASNRQTDLENILDRLQAFKNKHDNTIQDIDHATDEFKSLKPIGSEVEAIKFQQKEFSSFRKRTIEPLIVSVDEVNGVGQRLIQSAARGVNTSVLEKDLEKMNDKWNALKEKLNDRDRRLDYGLLQSGKFQEALDGFAKWLADTEELVSNQKPPSADYKVVKAQLQEQKFLKKMLADRQNSMSSIFEMGNEVLANADPRERKEIESQLKELSQRFNNLDRGATKRMDDLQKAMVVAKEFLDKITPLLEWLDKSEKKIKDMELIPTDEEKIQQRIKEHSKLHNEILSKNPEFHDLTEVASSLMALVGEEEASGVADRIQETADRYAALVNTSERVGQLLQDSRAGLRHLVLTYQDLQAWMEGMEKRLSKYKVLPVHTDKLVSQMEDIADLCEEISNHQSDVDGTVDAGMELMKHITSDEAIQLKDKLDVLQRRYNDLVSTGTDLLKNAESMLPLVQQFHNAHKRLGDWMLSAESQLQAAEPKEEDIHNLELDIQEFRPVLENINQIGPQLCQMSPGEGASTIEGLVTRDNRRFDAIAEQIQRKAERIHLSKQRSLEVIGDMDDLLDWFREVENQLRDAEPPSSEVDVIRVQLKEHKALNDDISSQKGRGRDVLSMAKKVLREVTQSNDSGIMREKMEDLREVMEHVSSLSAERLSVLEQALPLAQHFQESHFDLCGWLDDMERHVSMMAMPALRPELIAQQQDKNEAFLQSIAEHKPLVDKLNKTGEALIRLCNEEEGLKIQDIMDSDNARYAALRAELRQRQQALEKALQETSQFSDKLEGMLRALQNTAEQVSGAEPISAHPPKIRDQQDENDAVIEDLNKRADAFQAVKRAANDVINKAPNSSDPAVKDIKRKLDRLNSLWNEVQEATNDRGRSLEEALILAERFWDELQNVMGTLKNLQDSLHSQDPPAVEPAILKQQKAALKEIKAEIDQTKPEVEQCRASGQKLMKVCGDSDKPEVKKHIEDLDNAWETVTALFARREENLIQAMEKSMQFHETLKDLLKFLDGAERRFANLGPLGTDIKVVKNQIGELKNFKSDIDPQMVKVEALNRQAQELTESTTVEQAAALKQPLTEVNRRWENLLKGIVERQRQLENSLLQLGQFHHALAELLAWIDATNKTLDKDLKPVAGDYQLLEIELAKLKVLVNDIHAHQSSVDTLNDAGRQLIENGKGSAEASSTQEKLNVLNKSWRDLLQKAADRQLELEDALQEAQRFAVEIQDLLSWLGEVDGVIATSKPVGGLPETASEQLERFMEVYDELESNRPKVETVLAQGQEYLKKSPGSGNLQQNLKTLKQRWDSVTARANDKKIKLEIALKEATEFHNALQAFVDWLTDAEKTLSNLKPVSRILATILSQIEDHKVFQKDVSSHREIMLHLDKKGTHLKYFSQKQDVILIKNLLISVQHRFERVVSKSAERTRALDHGYKEAREFNEAWSSLMEWLTTAEKNLDELTQDANIGNDPERIKQRLAKHRDVQRALSGKQATYDSTMRMGKALKEKAPKSDEQQLNKMINELKEKWNLVCSKSVDRQRKLEEALLYCGQFKDAMEALLDWLRKTEKRLTDDGPVHGDLDTVMALVEQHKAFEETLSKRFEQMKTVRQTGKDLMSKASTADRAVIQNQLDELEGLWNRTSKLCDKRTERLEDALKQAEQLHKSVHLLLEWLSDAEMKLRFIGPLPDNEQETRNQLNEHRKFMQEMSDKQHEKDSTVALAQRILEKAHPDAVGVIKHWITIIQSRWEEVWTWAQQREQKLVDHLQSLQDLDSLLEELFSWLTRLENRLLDQESEPLPDSIEVVEKLIDEHREFMESTAKRQTEVDTVCKVKQPTAPAGRKPSAKKISTISREDLAGSLHDLTDQRRQSRGSPIVRDKSMDNLPHIGPRFPPKGSKVEEPLLRNSRCRQLWDKWHNVWLMAWERQRRLQEHLNYLREVEKVRNFSWDLWRKRFLKFMNHKKSRLTDLFRKMDKNNDGLIPRDDFIDGIMKTKFDTSKLEMNAVADMFDHDKLGLIDWKEFIAALRPDWEEKKPDTESEKIHDEVKRLVMLCTCRQKFRVFQVGEGRYRFGDSQKLRLVRILRSTVMVRVGGGWVALDEFLVKNDPCRAKGRTNIELREQFILADGVSQSMSAFKPKHNTQQQQRSGSTAGPITKVRERSARSVPMGKMGVNRTAGTPDSLSDNESSPYSRTPVRKSSTPVARKSTTGLTGSLPASRPGSRPQSRPGSKPPSRHGSNMSLDSTDSNTPSRIPRFTPGKTPTTSSARKSTGNGQVGTGRATRSPSTTLGNQSSASSTRSSLSMHRSSSIPTLSNSSSSNLHPHCPGSRIPVPAAGRSSSRDSIGTVPTLSSPMSSSPSSGLQSPLAAAVSLARKPSSASESKRRDSKSSDSREPFRL